MIRKYQTSDYNSVEKMLKDEFNISFPQENSFSRKLVCAKDENIVGILLYSVMYERAEIDYICVKKEFRNKNIATDLINEMFTILIQDNVETVSLEVRKSNIPARSFYKKMGFSEVSIRSNYYKNEDGILMVRHLVICQDKNARSF